MQDAFKSQIPEQTKTRLELAFYFNAIFIGFVTKLILSMNVTCKDKMNGKIPFMHLI